MLEPLVAVHSGEEACHHEIWHVRLQTSVHHAHDSEDVCTSFFFVKRRKHLSKMFTKKTQARTCVMVQERSVLISTGCLRDIHDTEKPSKL